MVLAIIYNSPPTPNAVLQEVKEVSLIFIQWPAPRTTYIALPFPSLSVKLEKEQEAIDVSTPLSAMMRGDIGMIGSEGLKVSDARVSVPEEAVKSE